MTRSAAPAQRLHECGGFLPFWTAATVSGFGTYVTMLAIQVIVVENLHGGAAAVGVVNATRWLPYLLFGLVVGVFVDRCRRRPLLIATDFGRGVLLIGIPMLALTDHLTLAALVAFMVVAGAMSLVNVAASQSFLPRVVPARLLASANARLDQSDAVAQTSGPALAGGLVAVLTAPWAVLIDAASYIASGVLLLRVRIAEPMSQRLSLRGVRAEAIEGLQWIYRHRTLRPHALGTHAWFVCMAITGAVLPPFALRTLHLGALGYGIVLAFGGLGAVLGALVAVPLGRRFGVGRVVVAGVALEAVAFTLVAASPGGWVGWILFGGGELLFGFGMGATNANEMGYRQAITPDHLQARTNTTVHSINRAAVVIGAPIGGLVAEMVGLRTMLLIVAAGFLLVAVYFAASPFRHASLSDAAPAPSDPP